MNQFWFTFGNPGLGPTTHLLAPYYKTSWEPSLPAAELCESAACESCDDQLGTCSLASQFPSERSTNNNKLDMYFWKKIKKNQKSTDEIGLPLLNHGVRHALRAGDVLPISRAKAVGLKKLTYEVILHARGCVYCDSASCCCCSSACSSATESSQTSFGSATRRFTRRPSTSTPTCSDGQPPEVTHQRSWLWSQKTPFCCQRSCSRIFWAEWNASALHGQV